MTLFLTLLPSFVIMSQFLVLPLVLLIVNLCFISDVD